MTSEHWRALARVQVKRANGYTICTAFPVAENLLLTARHGVTGEAERAVKSIAVSFCGRHTDGGWVEGVSGPFLAEVVWSGKGKLDAALLRVEGTRLLPPPLILSEAWPKAHERWDSMGFPKATKNSQPTLAMKGTTFARTPRSDRFQIEMDAPPKMKKGWAGASGAPIFVGSTLFGIIVEGLGDVDDAAGFENRQVLALGAPALLADGDFRKLVRPPDPELEKYRDEVVAHIRRLLEGSERAAIALATQLPGSPNEPTKLASYLVSRIDIRELIVAVDSAQRTLEVSSAEHLGARLLADILRQTLPILIDHGLVSAFRQQDSVSIGWIELPIATASLAEIVMAGSFGRAARFVASLDRGLPAGEDVIYDPHRVETGLLVQGFLDEMTQDLARRLCVEASDLQAINGGLAYRAAKPSRAPLCLIVSHGRDKRADGVLQQVRARFPSLKIVVFSGTDRAGETRDYSFPIRTILERGSI